MAIVLHKAPWRSFVPPALRLDARSFLSWATIFGSFALKVHISTVRITHDCVALLPHIEKCLGGARVAIHCFAFLIFRHKVLPTLPTPVPQQRSVFCVGSKGWQAHAQV